MEAAFAALKIFLYGKKTKNEEKKNVFVKTISFQNNLSGLIQSHLSHHIELIKLNRFKFRSQTRF